MTTNPHTWQIGPVGQFDPYASGAGAGLADAWLNALSAAHPALVSGALDSLSVYIDDELEALYTPSRDHEGAVDPAEITQALLRWYQDITAPDHIARIIGETDAATHRVTAFHGRPAPNATPAATIDH